MPDQVIGNEIRTTPWADPDTGSPDKQFPSNVASPAREVPHHNGQTLGVDRIEPTLGGTLDGSQKFQPNDGSKPGTNGG